jgi:uncharacterized protein
MRQFLVTLLLAITLIGMPNLAAADESAFPALTGPVVDLVDEIPAEQEAVLSARLRAFQKQTGHQLQIVTLPDLGGRSVEEYGVELGRHWGIGRKGVDDGILLIHAVKERKISIATGKGAEGYLTDAVAGRIRRDIITPAFKQKRFAEGIIAGADALMKEAAITPEQRAEDNRLAAAALAKSRQRFMDGLSNVLAVVATIFCGWLTWFVATTPRRRRKAEEQRLAREQARQQAAERQRAEDEARTRRLRAAQEAAEKARLQALKEREERLAAMSPRERARFLKREEDQRLAQEAEARRRAEAARQQAIRDEAAQRERREAQRRRDEEDERIRQASAASSWSSPSSSSSSSSNDSWGGGGGDFGGGGSSGDY